MTTQAARSASKATHGAPRRTSTHSRQGALFERAYCNSPLCTPSRQSLITGLLPHAVGVTQLATPLPEEQLTLAEWLADQRYHTAAIGKMHFNGPSSHGFVLRVDTQDWLEHLRQHPPPRGDERRPWRPFVDPARQWLNAEATDAGLPVESMEATYFVDRAIEYLRGRHNKPFFLVVSFYDPHSPFRFPRDWQPRFSPENFQVPQVSKRDRREQPAVFASLSPDDVRGIQAAYFTSLSFVDAQVGRLVRELDSTDLRERTLVVYVGDNGYMLGQHGRFEKHCMYEPAVRIPLIMRWPGHVPAGQRISDLVEMVNIAPTALHLLKLPTMPNHHGLDIAPLVQRKPGALAHDVVFSEYLENEEAMVRSSRFKLIVGTGQRLRQDGYHTAEPLPAQPYERLFDEIADPEENNDLSEDSRFSAVKDELIERMYERLVATRSDVKRNPRPGSIRREIDKYLVPPDKPPPPRPAPAFPRGKDEGGRMKDE